MKLGLLLVLVVAALLPNLSESRIVSKCELKEKLGEKIDLPRNLRKHKDEILSIIICEINRKSNLDTSLVNVDGIRLSMTTAQPTTEGMEPETDIVMTAAPAPATTTTTTTTTATEPVSSNSTAASGGSRKKRRAPSRRSYESQESLNDMENKFDEEEMEQDDERMSKESSSEEGGSSHQGIPNKITLWSLGYYGVFQLRDSLFCDSGYRWSKNLCGKSCSDFTNDDITDDIECFINSNYHWYIFRSISHECFGQRKTFLQDCS